MINPLKTKLLLVDYENVPQVELERLDPGYRVVVFVGASQKSVPIELVTAAQRLGDRLEWRKVSGDGRNALDFFIAWHLGRVFEQSPRPECVVLSKDKGFDPLLRHLNACGLKCRRIDSIAALLTVERAQPAAVSATGQEANLKRIVELLGRTDKRSRPRKRRTLAQAISAMFQKKLSRTDIDALIDTLLERKLILDAHGIITYEF